MRSTTMNTLVVAAGIAATVVAGWMGVGPALAAPTYTLLTDIAIPVATSNSSGGQFTTFDISAFDGNTQLDYVSDRSNDSVDVFSSATDSFVTRLTGYVGVAASNSLSGPDGVAIVNANGQHILWSGDGTSTAKAYTIGGTSSAPIYTPLTTINTGGKFRVDEMAYDPTDNRLLVANNADTPPFATLINTTTSTVAQKLTFNGTTAPASPGGIEASAFSKTDDKFYLNLVQLPGGSLAGGIAEIDPLTGNTVKVFDLSTFGITDCSPAGIAVTSNNKLFIGCGDATQNILFDPNANGGNGAVLKTFAETSGTDEVWCDPTSGLCFAAARTTATGLGSIYVVDPVAETLVQTIATAGGAHSVTVDPVTGQIFVPEGTLGQTDPACLNGCIAVFASVSTVPEPASLPVLGVAVLGLAGLGLRRRRPV